MAEHISPRRPRVRALLAGCLIALAALVVAATVAPADAATRRAPVFEDVAALTPADAVAYLGGRRDGFPSATVESINNFSASNILETMDTAVLDAIRRSRGEEALAQVHEAVARAALDTLVDVYGQQPVVVALDAGHGGRRGYYFDPGSEGTESEHTRAVVTAMERLVGRPAYTTVTLRRVFNDDVADDFRLPRERNEMVLNQLVMRQARASLLAGLVARWNADHPDEPAAVHEISVHFNAGANGLLVLHQSAAVNREFAERSRAYAERYTVRGRDGANATGLLPAPLKLWAGTGLHDDLMMYAPSYISAAAAAEAAPRYSTLQGNVHLVRYAALILDGWR